MTTDVIIVGQGMAGSLLAWQLLQKSLRVIVIDDSHRDSASTVAAGLMSPVGGKRLLKSQNVDCCLPAAVTLYRTLEAALQRPLYHELPLLRRFNSQEERTLWQQRRSQAEYRDYLGEESDSYAPYGGGYIRQAGYLDTRALLTGMQEYLKRSDSYIAAHMDYADLRIEGEHVEWRGRRANYLVFCEGYRLRDNPWFSSLPLQPAQGDILTLKVFDPAPAQIINDGQWLLPVAPDQVKVGATFQWEPLDGVPSDAGKRQLLQAFGRLWPAAQTPRVLAHDCGVRPSTRDKKPFIGLHSRFPGLGVFNGFGAKGALLMPYYAEIFADFLCGSVRLPIEVDIARFDLS